MAGPVSQATDPIIIAGVDEAGRGPLAGPVVAAAVVLQPGAPIDGLADSKQLTDARRRALAAEIQRSARAWCIARAEVGEIDRLNILQATMLAMQRAVEGLALVPELALVDGNRLPALPCEGRAVIKGDQTEPAISAASILAKVSRDDEMLRLDKAHPEYGFAAHKGYPTRAHREALSRFGVTEHHRRSFGPVRSALQTGPNRDRNKDVPSP